MFAVPVVPSPFHPLGACATEYGIWGVRDLGIGSLEATLLFGPRLNVEDARMKAEGKSLAGSRARWANRAGDTSYMKQETSPPGLLGGRCWPVG